MAILPWVALHGEDETMADLWELDGISVETAETMAWQSVVKMQRGRDRDGDPWGFLGLWDWKSLMMIINYHYYHYCYLDDLDDLDNLNDLDAEANLSVCLAKQQLPVLIH